MAQDSPLDETGKVTAKKEFGHINQTMV